MRRCLSLNLLRVSWEIESPERLIWLRRVSTVISAGSRYRFCLVMYWRGELSPLYLWLMIEEETVSVRS